MRPQLKIRTKASSWVKFWKCHSLIRVTPRRCSALNADIFVELQCFTKIYNAENVGPTTQKGDVNRNMIAFLGKCILPYMTNLHNWFWLKVDFPGCSHILYVVLYSTTYNKCDQPGKSTFSQNQFARCPAHWCRSDARRDILWCSFLLSKFKTAEMEDTLSSTFLLETISYGMFDPQGMEQCATVPVCVTHFLEVFLSSFQTIVHIRELAF